MPARDPRFDDVYFNEDDGLDEARYVFVDGNRLKERFSALSEGECFQLGELGFATGRSMLAAIECFEAFAPPSATLHLHSVEAYPMPYELAREQLAPWPEAFERHLALKSGWPLSIPAVYELQTGNKRVTLWVWVGPVVSVLKEMNLKIQAWFFDGYSPSKNPEMWSEEVFSLVAANSVVGATGATYTAAGAVRRALGAAGFEVKKVQGFGRKRHMTTATLTAPGRRRWSKPAARYPAVHPSAAKTATVVGAGVAGALVARELAEAGVLVRVFEKNTVASGASGNPVGLVQPLPGVGNSTLCDWYSRGFVASRTAAMRFGLPWRELWIERYNERHKRTAEALLRLGWTGVIEEPIGDEYLRLRGALVWPVSWCERLLEHPNIELTEGAAVSSVGEGCVVVNGERVVSDVVVVCNSAAARELVKGLPLHWVRGQLGCVADEGAIGDTAKCHSGYVLPGVDGRCVVGATYQRGDGCTTFRQADWLGLVSDLQSAVPGLEQESFEPVFERVSFRGVTDGRLPYIGAVVDEERAKAGWSQQCRPCFEVGAYAPRLFVSVGHGSRGFSSGPLAAVVLRSQIVGGPCPVSPALLAAVHPARVLFEQMKRR